MTYIDKDKALNLDFKINVNPFESRRKTAERAVQAYANAISEIPAADVRPMVRGHKVTHNRPIAGYWASGKLDGGWDGMEGRVWVEPIMDNPVDYCSGCGKRLDDTFQNFCPNCGAMMEES